MSYCTWDFRPSVLSAGYHNMNINGNFKLILAFVAHFHNILND